MLAERFPERIRFGALGGPAFQTSVVRVQAGGESRNRNWADMRHRYDVSQCIRTVADFASVRAHFINAGGRELAFPYKDWADWEVATSEGRAESITSTTFRLQKAYTVGSATTLRDIRLPRLAGFVPRISGTPISGGLFTLNESTGVLTVPSEPAANTLTWSGEFDVLARYDIDELRAEIVNKNGDDLLISWSSIPLVEVTGE